MRCTFAPIAENLVRCRRCRLTIRSPHPPERIHAACRRPEGPTPTAAEPRDDAEVARLAAVCRTNLCGAFDAVADGCRLCGCASSRPAAWLSRLRLARCPRGLW